MGWQPTRRTCPAHTAVSIAISCPSQLTNSHHPYALLTDYSKDLEDACFRGSLRLAKEAVEAGASLRQKDGYGWTPLARACAGAEHKQRTALARWILSSEEGLSTLEEEYLLLGTGTPLWAAASWGNAALVRVLLEHGADVQRQFRGESLLPSVLGIGYLEVLSALLAVPEVDVNGRQADGMSALHIVATQWQCDHEEAMVLLLERGAAVDATCERGQTALIAAARAGLAGCVRVLLRYGADCELRDLAGDSALDRAKALERDEVVAILEGG